MRAAGIRCRADQARLTAQLSQAPVGQSRDLAAIAEATEAIGSRSASRRIATICSSVNLLLRIFPSGSEGSVSSSLRSKNPWGGSIPFDVLAIDSGASWLRGSCVLLLEMSGRGAWLRFQVTNGCI